MKVKVVALKKRPYALRWIDRETGTERQQSSGTYDRAEAERIACEIAERLVKAEQPEQLLWTDFRKRVEREFLPERAKGTQQAYRYTLDLFQKCTGEVRLAAVNGSVLSEFQAYARQGRRESTVRKHLRQLRAVLQWAYDIELVDRLPRFRKPPRGALLRRMKGRPLGDEEFKRLLAAIPEVVPAEQVEVWAFFLKGLYYQGLRLGEALCLSWDREDSHRVDLEAKPYPMMYFRANLEKARRGGEHPLAPEFVGLLSAVPEPERRGEVFCLPCVQKEWVSKLVCRMGRKAGIVVLDEGDTVKYASCHDLRRSFAKRWQGRVGRTDQQELMRHSDASVTEDYYTGPRPAAVLAGRLWEAFSMETRVVSGGGNEQNAPAVEGESSEVVEN